MLSVCILFPVWVWATNSPQTLPDLYTRVPHTSPGALGDLSCPLWPSLTPFAHPPCAHPASFPCLLPPQEDLGKAPGVGGAYP